LGSPDTVKSGLRAHWELELDEAEEPDALDLEEEGVEEFDGLGEPDEFGEVVVEELLLLSLLLLFDAPSLLGLVSEVLLPSV
jgi:hypothetical protein